MEYNVGDKVRIVDNGEAQHNWIGFICTVKRTYPSGDLFLEPCTNRPDGHEMKSFYWPMDMLEAA